MDDFFFGGGGEGCFSFRFSNQINIDNLKEELDNFSSSRPIYLKESIHSLMAVQIYETIIT